jgi:hypothetical protein
MSNELLYTADQRAASANFPLEALRSELELREMCLLLNHFYTESHPKQPVNPRL